MSPAKPKKSAKRAGKPAPKGKASKKPSPKAAKRAAPASRKPSPRPAAKAAPAARPASAAGHAHCAASDPFGDACQNLPRRPSKYCVIHSYLDR